MISCTEHLAVDSMNYVFSFCNPFSVYLYSTLAEKLTPHTSPSNLAATDKDYSYSSIDVTS